VIERGLVSGLFLRRSRAAGRYGDPRNGSKSMKRARGSGVSPGFTVRICSIFCPFRSSASHTPSPASGCRPRR